MEESIQVIVPRLLIKKQFPHPELYGEILVELLNGMITDVYTDIEDGHLFTITNDEELINYLLENKIDEPFIEIKNKELTFRTLLHKDRDLLLKWFNSELLNQYEYNMQNIIEFISHTISSLSHQFIINYKDKDIGLFGYSITGDATNINLDIYYHEVIKEEVENFIFKNALNYIDNNISVKKLSTIILASDNKKIALFFNNGFDITETIYLPVSETGYKEAYVLTLDLINR